MSRWFPQRKQGSPADITTSRELFVKGQPVLAWPLVDASSCLTVFSVLAGPQALCCKNLWAGSPASSFRKVGEGWSRRWSQALSEMWRGNMCSPEELTAPRQLLSYLKGPPEKSENCPWPRRYQRATQQVWSLCHIQSWSQTEEVQRNMKLCCFTSKLFPKHY